MARTTQSKNAKPMKKEPMKSMKTIKAMKLMTMKVMKILKAMKVQIANPNTHKDETWTRVDSKNVKEIWIQNWNDKKVLKCKVWKLDS